MSSAGPPIIKPQHIDTLPYFDEERKQKYKAVLQSLWNNFESAPNGSPQHAEAEQKLRSASQRIMAELSSRTSAARPAPGPGPQRPPQPGGQMAGQPQQGGTMQSQAATGAVQGASGQQGGQQGGGGGLNITPAVRDSLSKITIHVPSNIPPGAPATNYKQRWFAAAAEHLGKREKMLAVGRTLQQRQQQMQAQGQEVTQQMLQQIEQAKRSMGECEARYKSMLQQNDNIRQTNQQAAQQGQASQQPQANGNQVAQEMKRSTSNNAQNQIKQEQRTSMSPPQPRSSFPPMPPQQQQVPATNQPTPAPNVQQNMAQQSKPQQAHQTTQSVTQPQPPQNFPQHTSQQYQQQSHQHQRPPMNPQLSQTQIPQQQHQITPTSAVPQSAVQQSQPPQRPQALSQQAAMAQAASEYQRDQQMARQQPPHPGQQQQHQQQPQQQQQQQPVPNGVPFNPPPSATQATPNSAFPPQQQHPTGHLQPTGQTPTNKFPIKPTMQLNPQLTAPVPGPPSRPTMANQSMTQQPGLTRPQPFTLEGEGDRVLSKRKLDELTRQVTGDGGGSTTDHGDGVLSAEVEESMLQLADDFVDNVITSACRLAKLRPNMTLDVRDVQLVLERNYGIRIPGFGLDEVRAVRKFQPAPGWQSKMQAVQTAKTLGGVGKGDS